MVGIHRGSHFHGFGLPHHKRVTKCGPLGLKSVPSDTLLLSQLPYLHLQRLPIPPPVILIVSCTCKFFYLHTMGIPHVVYMKNRRLGFCSKVFAFPYRALLLCLDSSLVYLTLLTHWIVVGVVARYRSMTTIHQPRPTSYGLLLPNR